MALELIDEAVTNGARLPLACQELGISRRTRDRWKAQASHGELFDRRTLQKSPAVALQRRLTQQEREQVIHTCNSQEFASKPPTQIVPILAERGQYLCSESTMYRIFREERLNQRRGRAQRRNKPSKPNEVRVTETGQCCSWDITFLPTLVKGLFFKLYMILDLYSRKIIGWEVHERECGTLAAELLYKTCLKEGLKPGAVLHSDNGAPMKAQTMLAMMEKLQVTGSFSRPSVSNDNPFSESAFKTLKYVPMYPEKPFETIEEARQWVHQFVTWYNNEHRHSGVRYVTPNQKHKGDDLEILSTRSNAYEKARSEKPLRWAKQTRNWSPVTEVVLNPDHAEQEVKDVA